jgi:hypothetical protein
MMRKLFFLLPGLVLLSCGQRESEPADNDSTAVIVNEPVQYLISKYTAEEDLYFTDQNDSVIIQPGKYLHTTSDTIRHLGFVFDSTGHWWAINHKDSVLFEVYNFDNGPDYVEEGLFRIVKNDLMGFADEQGNVVIEPQYKCAWPFENGSAKVSNDCEISTEFEMTKWESANWFYINRDGKKVNPESLEPLPGQD